MTTTMTKLEPAEVWMKRLREGFAARGKDFKRHPVLVKWMKGQATLGQLRLWAAQEWNLVKSVETSTPRSFDDIPEPWRTKMVDNDLEERTGAISKTAGHPTLFRSFCEGIGLSRAELERRSAHLLPTAAVMYFLEWVARCRPWYYRLAAGGVLEDQVQPTFRPCADALLKSYRLAPKAALFFEVHEEADKEHGDTATAILSEYATTQAIRDELSHVANHAVDLLWDMWMTPETYPQYAV